MKLTGLNSLVFLEKHVCKKLIATIDERYMQTFGSFEKVKAKSLRYKMVIILALAQGCGIFILRLSTLELENDLPGP